MTTDNLKNTLKELHQRLESAGTVDAELKSLLHTLDGDIQRLLNQQAQEPDAGLSGRAQELSARFAAQHPQLETALRELAQTLERMGI